MHSLEDMLALLALAVLFIGTPIFYGWLIWDHLKRFFAAMIRLRDRIDRSDDSLR